MFSKFDFPRQFCMDSTEFKQASDGMPFVCNGRTFLKFNGWALPVTQLRRAGINMTEKYLNSPIPISFGDTTSISSNNVEFDLPKILNAFVTEDRNRVNLKTECENSDSKFAMVKREVLNLRSEFKVQAVDIQNLQTEVIKLNDENQKLELSTLQAEERSCSAESRCATLEAQLQAKDLQLEAKNQEIARIQAEAAQHSARFSKTVKFFTSPRVLYPVGGTVAVLEIAAHQTQIPQVAPSYWVRRGLTVVGKIPSKMWKSIFDTNESNSTNSVSNQEDTISSKIEVGTPLFDLSSNSIYTAAQGTPPVTPPVPIHPFIPFFSFTLLM